MKKFLLYLLLFFSGFFIHAYFFTDFFPFGYPHTIAPTKETVKETKVPLRALFTYVNYKDGEFSPKVVFMERGTYLSIKNQGDQNLMWLTSNEKAFNTARGYGRSEQALTRLDKPSTFTVTDKLHPESQLTVVVK